MEITEEIKLSDELSSIYRDLDDTNKKKLRMQIENIRQNTKLLRLPKYIPIFIDEKYMILTNNNNAENNYYNGQVVELKSILNDQLIMQYHDEQIVLEKLHQKITFDSQRFLERLYTKKKAE